VVEYLGFEVALFFVKINLQKDHAFHYKSPNASIENCCNEKFSP